MDSKSDVPAAPILLMGFAGVLLACIITALVSVFPFTPPDPAEVYGLPAEATDVREEGRGWVTFTLEANRRRRRWLYHPAPGPFRPESLADLGDAP